MNVSIGGVELLVKKIEMGEDKKQNCIGPSPHDFRVKIHQNNPLNLVLLWLVRVLIRKLACWGEQTLTSLTRQHQLWHGASANSETFYQIVSKRGWDDEKYAVVHFFT